MKRLNLAVLAGMMVIATSFRAEAWGKKEITPGCEQALRLLRSTINQQSSYKRRHVPIIKYTLQEDSYYIPRHLAYLGNAERAIQKGCGQTDDWMKIRQAVKDIAGRQPDEKSGHSFTELKVTKIHEWTRDDGFRNEQIKTEIPYISKAAVDKIVSSAFKLLLGDMREGRTRP